MSDFLTKLSNYKVFVYLFPGVIFVILIEEFTSYSLVQENIALGVFLYYFIGLIISRIGSIIVEPILKKIESYADYQDYLKAIKKDDFIKTLIEESNTYRTLIALFLLFLCVKVYTYLSMSLPTWLELILINLGLLTLLVFSFIKQTKYIKKRILSANKKENDKN